MDVSFCISMPVGAWHPFLPSALASLIAQESDVRIAFLDASGDPRAAALAQAHASRLAWRRHGSDAGQSAAIIEGWTKAPGEILGWLNADDILMPGALAAVAARFRADPALDVVFGHSAILDDERRFTGYHWAVEPPASEDFSRILEGGVISQPSCFFRREAYERAGGLDADLHYTMDWDLWIRLYKSGARFGFIDAPLSQVLWGKETKTASFNPRRRAELRRIINTHAPAQIRAKTFRAFALHNLMGRIRPAGLRKRIARLLQRGRRAIYGLRADGLLEDGAQLHLAQYDATAKNGLRIEIEGGGQGVAANASVPLAACECAPEGLALRFAEPFAPARPLTVTLRLSSERPVYFRWAQWD